MAEFLLELFSEEIPARMQAKAADDLKSIATKFFSEQQLAFSKLDTYVTPRRLTLVVDGLPTERPAKTEEKKGPRVGSPDQAVQGFLKSAGLSKIEQAEVRPTDKGDIYVAVIKQPALKMEDVLRDAGGKFVAELRGQWPKSMHWNDGDKYWVRPLRRVLAVLDGKPIDFTLDFGGNVKIQSSNQTEAHRFMTDGKPIAVKNFADYQKQLHGGKVILDRAERKKIILDELNTKAAALKLKLRPDEGLLDEVSGLVEWPVVLIGTIDAEFMSVPDRVLITSMRQHQKYFSLLDADGRLSNRFALVANIEAKDGGKTIIAGNERVLRARLSDAKFFWEQDQKTKLEQRLPKLKDIVFHAKLGTIGQKVERLSNLAQALANSLDADPVQAVDAAMLCKADLVTGMVGEFPELQGYMGGQYARVEGELADVADAIADHYKPAGANDDVPTKKLSIVLAIADKIDTLVGFFLADEKPTGSKDPFALRRACLGVIRLILENNISVSLKPLLHLSFQNYADQMMDIPTAEEKTTGELLEFFYDRLKVYLKDQSIRHDIINAVLSVSGDSNLLRLVQRARAVEEFLSTENGAQLLAAYRRSSNIVKAEMQKDKKDYAGAPDNRLLQQEAEIKVFETVYKIVVPCKELIEEGAFTQAMQSLVYLRAPLDAFFEQVMVNTDDAEVRANRLRLLNQIRATMDLVADFSKIEG